MSKALNAWLASSGKRGAWLCRAAGLEARTLSRLRHGKPISLRLAICLDRGTKGALRAETLATDPSDVELIKYLRGEKKDEQ